MTTPLTELTLRLALLAAAHAYTVGAKQLDGTQGAWLEIKACRTVLDGARQYARRISIAEVERRGGVQVADEFDRQARAAFAEPIEPLLQS